MTGKIVKVSGPLIVAENLADVEMYDVVKVSDKKLIGEVIELRGDKASIQVYEETSGLTVGDDVVSTGSPLSVELGPGLIEGIFDGIQRPLNKLMEISGNRIGRGIEVTAISHEKLWHFVPTVKVGDCVTAGDVVGTVQETSIVLHKILVPYGVEGKITSVVAEGEYTVVDTVVKVTASLSQWCRSGLFARDAPTNRKWRPISPWLRGNALSTLCFLLQRAA